VRYLALATDYDGTLAHEGRVASRTIEALERLRQTGRKAILVTGRELPDLKAVFPRLDLFARVVAENGALLYRPDTGEERPLGEAPPQAFVARLRAAGCEPLGVGRVIVATREPFGAVVRDAIRELGLALGVIFNKGAVMVLPLGVNKESGLAAALDELGLSLRDAVSVGDAADDGGMLAASGGGVAVANALQALKERADFVTRGARGQGVEELIERLLDDDLRSLRR
jgi:HAD superfamily hydrolase (TIGR01484 family)